MGRSVHQYDDIRRRYIMGFLDLIFALLVRKNKDLSGYDLMTYISEHYGKLITASTLYPTLHKMESQGLLFSFPSTNKRKVMYSLTVEGKIWLDAKLEELKDIHDSVFEINLIKAMGF